MERLQGEEPLLSDAQECDPASGNEQGIPGSSQVGERHKSCFIVIKMHFIGGFLSSFYVIDHYSRSLYYTNPSHEPTENSTSVSSSLQFCSVFW